MDLISNTKNDIYEPEKVSIGWLDRLPVQLHGLPEKKTSRCKLKKKIKILYLRFIISTPEPPDARMDQQITKHLAKGFLGLHETCQG